MIYRRTNEVRRLNLSRPHLVLKAPSSAGNHLRYYLPTDAVVRAPVQAALPACRESA